MTQTVTLHLPDDALERYRRGAAVAGKQLDEFLVDRLAELVPPLAEDLPHSLRDDLKALEELDDQRLWEATRGGMTHERQREYERLLSRQSEGALSMDDRRNLDELGEEARRLAVRKAHAFMLLRWRGHRIPSREDLRTEL
jgi:hypothetical protein